MNIIKFNPIYTNYHIKNNKSNINKNINTTNFKSNGPCNKKVLQNCSCIPKNVLDLARIRVFAHPKYKNEYAKSFSQYAIMFYDKILSNDKLLNNNSVNNVVSEIALSIQSDEIYNLEMNAINNILSNKKIMDSENVNNNLGKILKLYMAPAGDKLCNKILSDEKLYDNNNIMEHALINLKQNPTEHKYNDYIVDSMISILDTYMNDKKLYENKNIKNSIGRIVAQTKTPLKAKFISKIFSEDKLINNQQFLNSIPLMLDFVHTEEELNSKIEILDKYLNTPELSDNKNVKKSLHYLVQNSFSTYRKSLIEKILSDKNLYDNKNLMNNVNFLLNGISNKTKYSIAEKILSNEEIYNNKYYLGNEFPKFILFAVDDKKVAIIERIMSDPKLYNSPSVYKNLDKIIHYEDVSILDKICTTN